MIFLTCTKVHTRMCVLMQRLSSVLVTKGCVNVTRRGEERRSRARVGRLFDGCMSPMSTTHLHPHKPYHAKSTLINVVGVRCPKPEWPVMPWNAPQEPRWMGGKDGPKKEQHTKRSVLFGCLVVVFWPKWAKPRTPCVLCDQELFWTNVYILEAAASMFFIWCARGNRSPTGQQRLIDEATIL